MPIATEIPAKLMNETIAVNPAVPTRSLGSWPDQLLPDRHTTGSGHRWRLVGNRPWKRACVTSKKGVEYNFRADPDGRA